MPEISGGAPVPQVASDPKIHAPNHSLPRIGRPAQQSERAPSPFESLLDDSAQTTDQSAPPPPENKAGAADSPQAPIKNNECKPATANDDAPVTTANPAETTVNPGCDGKPAGENKAAVNAKAAAATGDAIKTVDKDDKPPEGSQTDNPTATAPTDSIQTIITTSAVALAPAAGPTANQTPKPDPNAGGQPVELLQLSAMAGDGMPTLKGLDGPKAGIGKQAGAEKKVDAETQVDSTVSPAETTGDVPPANKVTPQSHADKPQFAASESDKDHVAQARGEVTSVGHRSTGTSESLSSDPSGASPSVSNDASTTTMVTEAGQTTPTGAAPPTAATAAVAQSAAQQAAPIPLAGLAVDIAGKAIAGKNRFEIRLDPPELGRIEVRLDVDRDGNVTSRLTVDRADTFDLLRRDAAGLERALQDAGLKTADNGLQFSLRDQSTSQQQTNGGSDVAQIVVQDEMLPSADAIPQNYGRLLGQGGGLDIRV
jgi:flagellar hook-length control protein FliK